MRYSLKQYLQERQTDMETTFKIGDKVQIKFTDMFSTFFGGGGFGNASSALGGTIKDYRVYKGKTQYKVSGFTGWWDEVNLQEA